MARVKDQPGKITVRPAPPPRLSLVPPDETPHDRFKRLANRRLRAAVTAVRALGRLSARGYERTEPEINKIEEVLDKEVESMLVKLRQGHEGEIGDFL